MSHFSDIAIDPTDAYRAALVSLSHTPIRFLPGAMREVAGAYGRELADVESDLLAFCAPPASASRLAQ